MKCESCGGLNVRTVFSKEGLVLKCFYCGKILRVLVPREVEVSENDN